jgi:diketogulonate reductase-like aldo/keto reductase
MHTVVANGAEIPAIGFGTYGMARSDMLRIIPAALKRGFRHIDTAQIYRNEKEVGEMYRLFRHPALRNIRHHESLGRQLSGESVGLVCR